MSDDRNDERDGGTLRSEIPQNDTLTDLWLGVQWEARTMRACLDRAGECLWYANADGAMWLNAESLRVMGLDPDTLRPLDPEGAASLGSIQGAHAVRSLEDVLRAPFVCWTVPDGEAMPASAWPLVRALHGETIAEPFDMDVRSPWRGEVYRVRMLHAAPVVDDAGAIIGATCRYAEVLRG